MYETIIVSDLHLGRQDCNITEFFEFIKENPSKKLVLNGDIFDQFAWFKDKGKLYKEEHKDIVKKIRKLLKERKTKIYYLIGNHDYLAFFLVLFGFLFGVKFRKRLRRKGIIIEHGDWITLYLWLRRIKRTNFQENCEAFAKAKNKRLVVGHSHHPEKMSINEWVYDEGDWVGNNTYLILEDWK